MTHLCIAGNGYVQLVGLYIVIFNSDGYFLPVLFFQIFDWMQRCEKLNFASYSSFFKYMGISGNLMKGLQVYDSISDKSTKMNVSVCNSVLGCLVRNAKFEKSMELFDQMKDDGLQPDLVTYSTVCDIDFLYILTLLYCKIWTSVWFLLFIW